VAGHYVGAAALAVDAAEDGGVDADCADYDVEAIGADDFVQLLLEGLLEELVLAGGDAAVALGGL